MLKFLLFLQKAAGRIQTYFLWNLFAKIFNENVNYICNSFTVEPKVYVASSPNAILYIYNVRGWWCNNSLALQL